MSGPNGGSVQPSPGLGAETMPDGKPVGAVDAPVGGQAVLEGVMMRGVSTWAVAVRNPEGEIEVTSEPLVSWAKRHRILRLPVIRGVVALGESLKIGFKALAISANAQLEEWPGQFASRFVAHARGGEVLLTGSVLVAVRPSSHLRFERSGR